MYFLPKLAAFLGILFLVSSAGAAEWQYAPRAGALLDLYLPPGSGPFQLVVAVHGGGWESGTRADAAPFCRIVLPAGLACATVEYQLAPAVQFPTPVDEIVAALAFLRNKAGELRIIPNGFILAGESAGGHLATLAAIRSEGDGIAGVAVFSGPFDLVALAEPSRPVNVIPEQISQLLGIHQWTPESIARMQSASPTFLVNGKTPPVLVIRGGEDRLVPASQSKAFCEKAMAAGVSCRMTIIPQAKHGLWGEAEVERFGSQWSGVFLEWARNLVPNRSR
jgi:acetyl esterase/lipase